MPKLAIVGAGIMGSNHARVARQLPDVVISHVIDADRQRGEALARSVGAYFQTNVEAVLGEVDAAVVAVPTPLHLPVGLMLMEAGIHVLMEKPIAAAAAAMAPIRTPRRCLSDQRHRRSTGPTGRA